MKNKYPGKSFIHCIERLLMMRSNCSGAKGKYSSSTTIRTGLTIYNNIKRKNEKRNQKEITKGG